MSVEEVDGEIVVVMKDNQYIGPMPKPTDAWNPNPYSNVITPFSKIPAKALTVYKSSPST